MSSTIKPVNQPLPVIIIGAGLGGLALANSLARFSIPFRVLERDPPSGRAQGYRVSLSSGSGSDGGDALKAVLSKERFELFEKTTAEEHKPGGRVDAKSGRLEGKGIWGILTIGGWGMIVALLGRVLGKKWARGDLMSTILPFLFSPTTKAPLTIPKSKDISYQVDRRVTRDVLLGPEIAPHVTYNAPFASYTMHPNSVQVHLEDGTSIDGSLLVGADGIRSLVASQLFSTSLPESQAYKRHAQDLNVRICYGKTPITPQLLAVLNPALNKGTTIVTDSMRLAPEDRMVVVLEAIRFDRTVDQASIGAGHQVDLPDDYIFWALTGRKEIWHDLLRKMDSAKVDETSSEQEVDRYLTSMFRERAQELSLAMIKHRQWDASVAALVEQQDPTQTAVLRIMSSSPDGPPVWDTSDRVTLLGDAVHCMPPTGGRGANTALWDGAALGQALTKEWQMRDRAGDGEKLDTWKWSRETLKQYEDGMRYNTGDIVGVACLVATYTFGGEDIWSKA